MAARRRRATAKGEALFALMVEVLETFFRLRAAGQRLGLVTPRGAGSWGLLRMIAREGALTVPQAARARTVARQYIQKLADELAEEGLIAFVDNPHHRRSRLMRLTAKGERRLAAQTQRVRELTQVWARDFDAGELRACLRTLERFRAKLERL